VSDEPALLITESPPVIDVHAHAMPLGLLEDLQRKGLADLSRAAAGVVVIDSAVSGLDGGAAIPFPPEQHDVAARLAAMATSGVDRQAVSAPPFLFASESRDAALTLDVVRRSNDALAEFVAQAPDQLVGLATLPVGHSQAAEELARCIDELRFAGATIGTFGGGVELDAPVNEELWAELARRRCFTLLHPSRVSERSRLADYHLVQLLGYPVETSLAVSRLIFGGVLDRYDLTLCLSHGGGCLPSVSSRLDLGWNRKPSARVTKTLPSAYLHRLLFDTAVFSSATLGRLVQDVGPENVLLGTDFPFDLADRTPVQSVRELQLSAHDEGLILSSNATRLLSGPEQAAPPSPRPWSSTRSMSEG
jgi:aminocarboxymuconate-semialdehyde decarboxylase